jgi:hypothetical protein
MVPDYRFDPCPTVGANCCEFVEKSDQLHVLLFVLEIEGTFEKRKRQPKRVVRGYFFFIYYEQFELVR